MRNLWIFLSKYNAFFLFIIFFVISFVLLVRNNSYQHATAFNSSNQIIGTAFSQVNDLKSYLSLKQTNESLAKENAQLRAQLKNSLYADTVESNKVNDTVAHQQYSYIVARVVNNSIHQKNNYITINRGKKQGITKDMGVICPTGIVGIVQDVSDNFATIRTLLHSESRISASIAGSNAFGSLVWGEGNYRPDYSILEDVPNHIIVKRGQKVVTSGFSLFPKNLPIGTITKTDKQGGNNFLDIEVKLSTDFSTLEYVYVVNNLMTQEQKTLETNSTKNE
ncbi:rod shape-determining protein MreC [Pedobacter sp. HMF7647]|uniref:Cell shape-determining protein MreC n=1 Tax=Hufsiella arboris TaxID=2695275 RepID=A0A7K1Y971_9SPHI|nr:rod shape-determining protein MreC [Hufsiella arboris]MXV51127.1 rod shape-determining protein MreC [Hufsiella arboris]